MAADMTRTIRYARRRAAALVGAIAFLVIYVLADRHTVNRVLAAGFVVVLTAELVRTTRRPRHVRVIDRVPTTSEDGCVDVVVPRLGEGMRSAEIVRWLADVGSEVDQGK